ncbi:hypothetical protein BST85_06400 [Aureitalea marina]|uniref:Tail specific protease domain-containing protein n=2 Tax=Aureitalea marina TaxID=930804 RepID=A0A2S7KPN5_9FLAO|nr:hypothetical protein BST85_06400 [Aureitalea marina]
MKQDLDLYVQLLTETHPGLYRYQSQEEFQKQVGEIQMRIQEEISFYDFYRQLQELSFAIRCAHTQLYPKEDVLGHLRRSSNALPFYAYPTDGKLYALFTGLEGDEILPGYEILGINGRTAQEIITEFERLNYRDGKVQSGLTKYLQGAYFCMTYYYQIDQGPTYDIELDLPDGSKKKITVNGQPFGLTERNLAGNPVNKEILFFYNKSDKNFDLEILKGLPNTARIRFSGFAGRKVNSEEQAVKKMRQFMDKSLKKIRKEKIENLVIELRGNGGGWDIMGAELISYLIPVGTQVDYYRKQVAITADSEFLQYSDLDPNDLDLVGTYLIDQGDGSYMVNPETNATLRPITAKPNSFKGNIYVMTDELTASSAAEFVAVFKSNKLGTIIGREAGGAYQGGNSGSFINFTLPNSGFYSRTPLLRYEMGVEPIQDMERGPLPDHPTSISLENLLTGSNPEEELLYQLIREGQD